MILGDEHEAYDPFHLDDPALQSGKHRRVMNLPGFVESIIPFVRPPHLKLQLNEQARPTHYQLLTTYRSPRTTHHAPRTTHHAPRTTHRLPLTAHHLL